MRNRQAKKLRSLQARRSTFERVARAARYWENRARIAEEHCRLIEVQIGRDPVDISLEAVVEQNVSVELDPDSRRHQLALGVRHFFSAKLAPVLAARLARGGPDDKLLRLVGGLAGAKAAKLMLEEGYGPAERAERLPEGSGITR